jgi:SAM-dependent methyltransferase
MATRGAGQEGIEEHLERWFEHIDTDFRATNLNQLICALTPPGRVLDIGCGSGALSVTLLKHGRDVVSQDLSERMVAMCRAHQARHGLQGVVRLGGVEEIPERHHFDAVVALDVIEHIEDDVGALRKMGAALTPHGTLVLSVPALSRLYGRKDEEVGHFRRYDRSDLRRVIQRAGFQVVSCRYWNLLGVMPVWISNLSGRRLDESVRYSRTPAKRVLNTVLSTWFRVVENPVPWPLGLTLIATARPRDPAEFGEADRRDRP